MSIDDFVTWGMLRKVESERDAAIARAEKAETEVKTLKYISITPIEHGTEYDWTKLNKLFAAVEKFKTLCDACYIGKEIPHLQRPGPLGDEFCKIFPCPFYEIRLVLEEEP